MPSLPHTIHGVIQEFSDDSAVIKLDNGETVKLPKHLTSESANAGSGVHLAIFSDAGRDPFLHLLKDTRLFEIEFLCDPLHI